MLLVAQVAAASPWMTGPLLAPSGKTIPKGHVNFEPYGFYTIYPDKYRNVEVVPIVQAGLTDFMDIQASLPYDVSWDQGQRGDGIGDSTLGFGFQVLKPRENSWFPSLRVTVQEVFPTGKYDHLNPRGLDTDQTGTGAYQTALGFNFQSVKEFRNAHYLRTRFSLVGARASSVKVVGVNTFGGSETTQGVVHPGNSFSADLAFEYTLTQRWVGVFEMLFANSSATNFSGSPGYTPGGVTAGVGGHGGSQGSLAPAIEYNFSPNVGLIAGVWFTVSGPRAAQYVANTIALNMYF